MISKMFKSKEELKLKPSKGKNISEARYQFNCGIDKAFSSIAERVDTYDKYKDMPEVFQKEHNKDWGKFVDSITHGRKAIDSDEVMNNITWRNWLFHFCFDEVK